MFSLALFLAILTVETVAVAVEVGEKAPDFTLPSTKGDPISLVRAVGCGSSIFFKASRVYYSCSSLSRQFHTSGRVRFALVTAPSDRLAQDLHGQSC